MTNDPDKTLPSRFATLVTGALIVLVTGCTSHRPTASPRDGNAPTVGSMPGDAATLARTEWLRHHAAPLRSVDPADEDFDDLTPIGRAIGDARIVFIGEGSHGDGSAYLGKTRLVKYLHERLGFDVVVWESGIFEAPRVWDAVRAGGDPVSALADNGMAAAWSWSGEIAPLAKYLASQARGPRPLYYDGFDPQLTARGSLGRRASELTALLDSLGLRDSFVADSVLWRGLRLSLTSKDSVASDSVWIEQFGMAVARLRSAMALRSKDVSSRRWQQVLESAIANVRAERQMRIETVAKTTSWASSNARDEQGAKNILWLANDRYRGHKLIVWSATIHAARNVAGVDTRDSSWSYAGYRPTGDHVWKALGRQMYALGFVALTGSRRLGPESWPIKEDQHPAAELEELLGGAGFDIAFLDFRNIPGGGSWLREPLLSRPFAEHAKIARWGEVLDGIVFLREMKPATWPDFEARLRRPPAH